MLTDEQLRAEAEAFVDEVWEDVVADIDLLVQVESVEDRPHAAPGAPFGPAPREALDRALGIASKLGLAPHDCDGYLGYGELRGTADSDAYLATIAHTDIVPLGSGWTFDPLRVTRKDGYLLGRGVIDDKGPLVLSLYAAHFFARHAQRTGEGLPYTLRCLIGANEETGMADVEHYLAHNPEPAFCVSPDAYFPVICGEKGLFSATVASAMMSSSTARLVSFEGGTAPNAVPGNACALVRAPLEALPARTGITVTEQGNDSSGTPLVRLYAHGKGGHASMPAGTHNAIAMLVDYLLDNGLASDEERAFLEFERTLFADTAGMALGIATSDGIFDPLTCIGGTIATHTSDQGTQFVQTIDCRYPTSTTGEALVRAIATVAQRHGCSVTEYHFKAPFYISPTSPAIRVLMDTYNEVTGRHDEAATMGGGTYARHFAHAVAFGPDDPSEPVPAWVGQEHGPDEGVAEKTLRRALVIYILAIARLMRLEW